jgi:hypothetical protein
MSSAPLLYRGITGNWPSVVGELAQPGSTRTALKGNRGVHVREAVRLQLPVAPNANQFSASLKETGRWNMASAVIDAGVSEHVAYHQRSMDSDLPATAGQQVRSTVGADAAQHLH